jgi:hypothetical protein
VRLDDEMQERAQCIPAEDGSKLGQIGMVLSKEEYRKRVGLNQSDWQEPQAAGNYPTKSTTETKEDYDVRVCIWNIRKETAELFKLGQCSNPSIAHGDLRGDDSLNPTNGQTHTQGTILTNPIVSHTGVAPIQSYGSDTNRVGMDGVVRRSGPTDL